MQKKIIALAVAGLASTAAFAQSNVTLYGIADASVSATSLLGATSGQTGFKVNSGALSTSRIGFKGVEDLGNGLKALFTLEYGLAIDDNTGVGTGAAAARQQFVGLTGGFGTVVAGRLQTTGLDFTLAGSALGGSTALGAVNVAGNGNLLNLVNAASRANNAVAYISPTMYGLTFAYNHARLSEDANTTGTTDGTANLFSVSYDNGPITAGAVYARTSRPDTFTGTPVRNTDDNDKEWGIRAGYDFKVAKLQAAYQQGKQSSDNALDGNGNAVRIGGKDSKWVVSATVPVGAKVALIAEYARLKINSDIENGVNPKNNVQAATLAATYALSKRTTAYAGFVAKRTDNDTNSAEYVADSNTYAVGLRHAF